MESGREFFPGQRFCPMEDELLMFYLKPKVNGMQVPGEGDVIFEFDLYGDHDPWTIWKKFEARRANDLRRNRDLYFFTQKKKKTARGSRASRTVGRGGTWKGQNKGQDVYLLDQNQKRTSTLLGSKKTYTYKNKGSVHDGCWIMYEFELDESQIHSKKQANKNEYVLCSLRKQNDVLLERKRNRQEEDEILEDFVEVADAENIDPESVLEEPQGKRRCLLPCADYVPTPSLEAEQEHFVVSHQHFLQSEPSTAPLENDQACLQMGMDENMGLLTSSFLDEAEIKQLYNEGFLQMGMDQNMGLLTPSFLDEAELKQLYNEEFLQPAPALEAEQGGQTPMEAEPVDAHQVAENCEQEQIDEPQPREETSGQHSQIPTLSANEIVCGLDFQQEENLVQQMGAEASSEVLVYGGNFVDAMVGEGWSMTFRESLMHDEQPNSMEVGLSDATSLDFGYNLAF